MSLPSTSRIADVIGPAVELLGYEFVACEVVPSGSQALLRVYIDSENGIAIKDCEVVSRQIGSVLDVENLFQGKYYLEVSSPGSDRLLVTEEHFRRFIGHRIKIKLRQARNGRSNYSGMLESVSNDHITIIVDGDTYALAIADIDKAKLIPES